MCVSDLWIKDDQIRFTGNLLSGFFLVLLSFARSETTKAIAQDDAEANLLSWNPRRTFSRKGVCAGGGMLRIESPGGNAVIEAGPLEIVLHAKPPNRTSIFGDQWHVHLLLEPHSKGNKPGVQGEKTRAAIDDQGMCRSKIHAHPGTHVLRAELIHSGLMWSGCVAYTRFRVVDQSFQELLAARDLCVGGNDDVGMLVGASSVCAPLLQMAHEKRLQGDTREAISLLTEVIFLSAMKDREGDGAHVLHVYPYCE
jgi:hypothetical protein